MSSRLTNLALLVLLIAALVTGAAAFGTGSGWGTWVVLGHGAVGIAIVVLAPWKSTIVGRGMRRARDSRWLSVSFGLAVVVVVATGVAHSTGLAYGTGTLSPLWVHVAVALVLLPLGAWHVLARPVRPRRTDLSRRALLRGGAVLGAAVVLRGALEGFAHLAGLPGARRRFTGSYEVATDEPEGMPVTMWLDDATPDVDVGAWRLTVRGGDGEREFRYDELAEFGDHVRATLDCTSGWYSTQRWEGVRLDRLLGTEPGGRSVLVRSRTGYARRFPVTDAAGLLLATRVGGEPLSAGHGHPVRLVAPGRRGFWWVKWVERVEVSDTPWWAQSPFPLT